MQTYLRKKKMRAAKRVFIVIASVLNPLVVLSEESPINTLNELRWQHRVILVSSPESCDQDISRLQAADSEIIDRDILWFAFCADDRLTNFTGSLTDKFVRSVRSRYLDEGVGVLLIGKDGGVKHRATSLDLIDLNQQIDAMPMRKQEIRERTE